MEEAVTDGDGNAHHRQLALVDVVKPISHSLSSSSSVTLLSPNSSSFSPNDGSAVQKAPGSDGSRSSTATPTNMIGTSKFTLPDNWSVHKVHRKVGGTTDKYYRDPETGRQFRSLKEVERFITEGVTPTKSRLKKSNNHPQKSNNVCILQTSSSQYMTVADEKPMMLDVKEEEKGDNKSELANVSPFQLPYGWVVKEVPRTSGDYVDKYYFEPGTGQRFRSLVAVQKHLADVEDNSPLSLVLEELRENSLPISKAFKLSNTIKNHGSYSSWKKSLCRKEEKSSPPSKIKWVIAGDNGDKWNAFVNDDLVQESVKQQWGDNFVMAIRNGKHNAQVSG